MYRKVGFQKCACSINVKNLPERRLVILTVLTVHITCLLPREMWDLFNCLSCLACNTKDDEEINLGKELLGKGGWGGKVFLSRSDRILLKGIRDDWRWGWQTMTGTFLVFVNEILSDGTALIQLLMISGCFGARTAELRSCSKELFPQRPYGPIGRPKIFLLCSFTESVCWHFFWDLKESEGDKKRGIVGNGEAGC